MKLIKAPNMDDMTEGDLRAVHCAFIDLRDYAFNKLQAIRCRRSGAINEALEFEVKCEELHREMHESVELW